MTLVSPNRKSTDREAAATAEQEADAVRRARLVRDAALSPGERLRKLSALCRQASLLKSARRLP